MQEARDDAPSGVQGLPMLFTGTMQTREPGSPFHFDAWHSFPFISIFDEHNNKKRAQCSLRHNQRGGDGAAARVPRSCWVLPMQVIAATVHEPRAQGWAVPARGALQPPAIAPGPGRAPVTGFTVGRAPWG